MWQAYLDAGRDAEERWTEGDVPVEIEAVATATGLDPKQLWDQVEGVRGWETHDAGYQAMVWFIAWELKGHPDWTGIAPEGM